MTHSIARLPSDWDIFLGKKHYITKEMTDEETVAFGKISRDFNPLHFSEELAGKTRFQGRIVHGMHTASLFSGVLAELTPWCVYLSQEIEFVAPVKIGDTIRATGEVIEINVEDGKITVALDCTKQDGKVVVRGKAVVKKLKEMYQSAEIREPNITDEYKPDFA